MITIKTTDLQKAVKTLSKVVPKNPVISILATVKVECIPGMLQITASNIDATICTRIPAAHDGEPVFCIDMDVLQKLTIAVTTGDVIFKVDGNKCIIKTNAGTTKCTTVDPKDFPELPVLDGENIPIPYDVMAAIISGASFCSKDSNGRPTYTAIHVGEDIVVTNGFYVAVKPGIKCDMVLVPASFAHFLTGSETIRVNGGNAYFATPDTDVYVRLLDQHPISYKNVMPDYNNYIIVSVDYLTSAVKFAIMSAKDDTIGISVDGDTVTITGDDAGNGKESSSEPISITNRGVVPVTIQCNARYLLQILSDIATDTVTIGIGGHDKPLKFSSELSTYALGTIFKQ